MKNDPDYKPNWMKFRDCLMNLPCCGHRKEKEDEQDIEKISVKGKLENEKLVSQANKEVQKELSVKSSKNSKKGK